MFSNLFTGTPSSTSSSQKNTNEEPPDLGQSRYDFKYLVFPNDLGMDDNGHYMVININVPTKTTENAPAGRYKDQFSFLAGDASKVDTLRYGKGGSLLPVVADFLTGTNSPDRTGISIPRRTRRIAESVALHMPTPLVYNTYNAYEEISLSALGGKLGSSMVGFALGGVASMMTKTAQEAINRATGGKMILDAVGNSVGSAAKFLQSPINPAVEILFSNTLVRQFTLEVLMAPRNEQESINMHSIIKTLRFHAAPEISDVLSLFWIPPAEFDITFFNKGIENMNILRINTCVLERIEVDYAPTGTYSTFRNGHPVAARLSMGFRELEPVHKKRVLQGF